MNRSPLVRELLVLSGFLAVASSWFGTRQTELPRSLELDEAVFKRVRIVDESGADRIVLETNKSGQGEIRILGTGLSTEKATDHVLLYGSSSGGSIRVIDTEGKMKTGMDAGNWPLGTLWVRDGTFEMASGTHIPRVRISSEDGGRIQLFSGQFSGVATPGPARTAPVDLRVNDGGGVLHLADRDGQSLKLEPQR